MSHSSQATLFHSVLAKILYKSKHCHEKVLYKWQYLISNRQSNLTAT